MNSRRPFVTHMHDQQKGIGRSRQASSPGIEIRAGDRAYFPAGALQIWVNPDGTTGTGASLAVDPWLPDLNLNAGTPKEIVDEISNKGFSVSTICNTGLVQACQKSQRVRELVSHPELLRLRYIVVLDGKTACGILDLDRARSAVRYKDPKQKLFAEDIYEPLSAENCLRGDSPLIDYLLTADGKPFRLVEMPGYKLGTIDVQDLQKLPVRALLFMYFCHLEILLARQLCEKNPDLKEIVRTEGGVDAQDLGSTGRGPERKIERYKFGKLLRDSAEEGLVTTIDTAEIMFLERFRNNLAHGPRWYITRRGDIVALVRCIKKVTELISEIHCNSASS